MNKTILIVSITATIILVMVSFTSVVSAQTTKILLDEKNFVIKSIANKKDRSAPGGIIQLILDLVRFMIYLKDNWTPGLFIKSFIGYSLSFLIFIFFFIFFPYTYWGPF